MRLPPAASVAAVLALFLTLGPRTASAQDLWRFEPPPRTLHLHFWHHSTGAAWLDNGLRDALGQVTWSAPGGPARSYLVSDYGYGGQNDYTYYGHWYIRFRTELGYTGSDGRNYVSHRPEAPGFEIPAANFMLTAYDYARQMGDTIGSPERLNIVMFKPCFPGSEVYAYDTEYDASTGNNGRGNVLHGTPHSDSGEVYSNFDYLDSVDVLDGTRHYTETFWPSRAGVAHSGGAWSIGPGDAPASLAQIKAAYRGMLNVFRLHPETLFVAVQAPPLNDMTAENIAATRELARWFREDWLKEYDPDGNDRFQDYRDLVGSINVAPFDYYDSIAYTGHDSRLDAEYFWFLEPGATWPDVFNAADNPLPFVEAACLAGCKLTDPGLSQNLPAAAIGRELGEGRNPTGDSHPIAEQHYHATDIFVGLKRSTASPGYRSWINAVTNRWLYSDSIRLYLTKAGGDQVRLQWEGLDHTSYSVHRGSGPVTLDLQAEVEGQSPLTELVRSETPGSAYFRVHCP